MRNFLIALAMLCTLAPFGAQFYGDRAGGWLMIDFRAYYCASLAQRIGHNPYLAESLRECEANTPVPFYHPPARVTVPAPYPPYALAAFAPLTFLPFAAAAIVWWSLLAIALAVASYALARITAQPLLVGWCALVLSLGLTSWTAGNVMPLGLAALLLAARFAQCGRFNAAGVAMVVAMIEPHIALPAAVALFAGYPAFRLRLIAGAAVLVIASLALGPALSIFYGTTVLPAHALSEVSRDNQYSIATVLAAVGLSDRGAVLVGSISYVAMAVVGIVAGLRLARRYGDVALALLVPVAVSLLGGSFVHTVEIAAAVSAALLLYTRARSTSLLAAVILLSVPWMLATTAAMFLAPLYPAAYLTYTLWRRDRTVALAVAFASYVLIFGLFSLAAASGGPAAHVHAYAPIDPRLAEASWRELVLGNTTNHPVMWLLRLPTWAGLLAFAAAAIALARKAAVGLTVPEGRLMESRA